MEIIVTRRLKAEHIRDIAYDMGLEAPKIATIGIDEHRAHVLTFGPRSQRQTIQIPSLMEEAKIRLLLAAHTQPLAPIMGPAVDALLDSHRYTEKQWAPGELEALKARKVAAMNRIHERVTKAMDMPPKPKAGPKKRNEQR